MNENLSLSSIFDVITENILHGITVFIPRMLTAGVIFLLGWFIAKIIQKSLEKILARVKIDTALERVGITDALSRIALRENASVFIPKILFYLMLIFIMRTAAEAAGLTGIADTINAALSYVPNIVTAFVIVILGSTLGQFIERAVTTAARNSGIEYANVLGRLTASLVMFVVLIFALAQLKIDMEIVNAVVLIIFAAFGACVALSLGLGTRDITRNLVAGFYIRRIFEVGQEVQIAGESGVVEAFTPLVILLRRDDRQVAVSNSAFLRASREQ